jgi:D-alanyl-D-alanine carboxypeptidase
MKRRRPKWRLGVLLASVAIAAVAPVATLLSAPSPVVPRGRVAGVARDGLLPARTPYPELLPCGDILVPIDKQHELPADCVPADLVEVDGTGLYLRAKATAAFRELAAAANRDGYSIGLSSAYRSYETQEATFAWWVGLYGLDQAERTSAHAGHSEHQLGTTIDLCAPDGCLESFSATPEAAWVAAHSSEFGFVVSYPEEKEAVTGFTGEAWHVRYVAIDVAALVRESGLTLHEYLLR